MGLPTSNLPPLKPVPYNQIEKVLGKPKKIAELAYFKLPFGLPLSWDKRQFARTIRCHKYIVRHLMEALLMAHDYFGDEFDRSGVSVYGGCFEVRKIRGGERLSTHSWGAAIDIAVPLGPLGGVTLTPYPLVHIFENLGFFWGGRYDRPDGMHFTCVDESAL